MNFKYSGLLFVLIVILEAINGLALNNASTGKSDTQDLVAVNSTSEKSQNTTQTKDGPVVVSKSPVTVIVANASEILPKSDSVPEVPTTKAPTTPAPPASPAPPAPPAPGPETGKWVIRDEEHNVTCIIAQMAMELNVTYPGLNKQIQNTTLNIPGKNSNASGNCSDEAQSMVISWGPGHYLQINFGVNRTAKNFFISGMSLNVNASVFKNVAENVTMIKYGNHSDEFVTPLDMSYKCNKVQKVELNGQDPQLNAVLSMKNTQFEAYMNKTKVEFGEAQDCDVFNTPDIVPIAVGSALAILVFAVLVAYLIGRRRSQNRGYLSM